MFAVDRALVRGKTWLQSQIDESLEHHIDALSGNASLDGSGRIYFCCHGKRAMLLTIKPKREETQTNGFLVHLGSVHNSIHSAHCLISQLKSKGKISTSKTPKSQSSPLPPIARAFPERCGRRSFRVGRNRLLSFHANARQSSTGTIPDPLPPRFEPPTTLD